VFLLEMGARRFVSPASSSHTKNSSDSRHNVTLAGRRVKSERRCAQDEANKTSEHRRAGRQKADEGASNGAGASDTRARTMA